MATSGPQAATMCCVSSAADCWQVRPGACAANGAHEHGTRHGQESRARAIQIWHPDLGPACSHKLGSLGQVCFAALS